jgi:hypothetical protein
MMITKIPLLVKFTNLYWNESGPEVYGDIQLAFKRMLSDMKFHDLKTTAFVKQINGELDLVKTAEYREWLSEFDCDPHTIASVGHRFVYPDDAELIRDALATLGC